MEVLVVSMTTAMMVLESLQSDFMTAVMIVWGSLQSDFMTAVMMV